MEHLHRKNLETLLLSKEANKHSLLRHLDSVPIKAATDYSTSEPIALREVLDIYRRRALHISEEGYKYIAGLDSLIPALENTTETRIRIHSLQTEQHEFIIFSDPPTTHIIGLLSIDKERKISESAAKGKPLF